MLSFRRKKLPKNFGKMNRITEGGKEGRTDGQTLIHRTLSATAGGPKTVH